MNFVDLLINGILAFILLSVGLSLEWKAFARTFSRPRSITIGLILRIIYLPLLSFAVVVLSDLPLEFKVGIIILGSVPDGMTSTFIVYLFNANPALAISITVINNFTALITVPLIADWAIKYFMGEHVSIALPFWDTVCHIFLVVIIPVFVGALIRRLATDFANRIENVLKWVTMVLLAILFAIKFFASESMGGSGITMKEIWTILPYSVVINFFALGTGWLAGKLLKVNIDDRLTLGVILGIQNTSLAFLITGVLLKNEAMLKPALVYSIFTFFTALVYGTLVKPGALKELFRRK